MSSTGRPKQGAQVKASKYGGLYGQGHLGKLDLADVDAELLKDAAFNVVQAGDCLMLSLTSDQGALCVRVLSGDQADRFYPTTAPDVEDVLRSIRDVAKTL